MTKIIGSTSATQVVSTIRGLTPAYTFSITSKVIGTATALGVQTTIKDILQTSIIETGGSTQIIPVLGAQYNFGVLYNLISSPSVGTVDSQTGLITRNTAGTIQIACKGKWDTRLFIETVAQAPANAPVLTGTVAGTNVINALRTAATSATTGKTPDTAISLNAYFAGSPGSSSSQFRLAANGLSYNSNCIYSNVDFTCVPIDFNGVLISPRHILHAWHATPPNGTVITFMTATGIKIKVTVLARATTTGVSDIGIAYISNELSLYISATSITVAKCLPTTAWLPTACPMPSSFDCGEPGQRYTGLNLGQSPYPLVYIKPRWLTNSSGASLDPAHDSITPGSTISWQQKVFILQNTYSKNYTDYLFGNSYVSGFDSGSPSFYVLSIAGTLTAVLRGCTTSGGQTGSCLVSSDFDYNSFNVTQVMNSLSSAYPQTPMDVTTYSLTRADFSSFTTY